MGKIVGGERKWDNSDLNRPLELLKEGDDLSSQWNSIQSTLKDVKTRGYEYQGPFDQNSNTFVREAVRNARLPLPTGEVTDQYGDTTHYWTPGADHLANPINPDQPTDAKIKPDAFGDRFGNWGSARASIAPPTAPDLPDSFNNRFGNWGSAPADDSSTPRSPVLRELLKYKRSAVPDGLAPTSAQRATPGICRSNSKTPKYPRSRRSIGAGKSG